jgi:hypothetical protein
LQDPRSVFNRKRGFDGKGIKGLVERQNGTWCTDLGGKRRTLAKGRENKQPAKDKLKSLLEEQALLARVNETITVACLAERFLDFAHTNLAVRTYESYKYGCQKFVDHRREGAVGRRRRGNA